MNFEHIDALPVTMRENPKVRHNPKEKEPGINPEYLKVDVITDFAKKVFSESINQPVTIEGIQSKLIGSNDDSFFSQVGKHLKQNPDYIQGQIEAYVKKCPNDIRDWWHQITEMTKFSLKKEDLFSEDELYHAIYCPNSESYIQGLKNDKSIGESSVDLERFIQYIRAKICTELFDVTIDIYDLEIMSSDLFVPSGFPRMAFHSKSPHTDKPPLTLVQGHFIHAGLYLKPIFFGLFTKKEYIKEAFLQPMRVVTLT